MSIPRLKGLSIIAMTLRGVAKLIRQWPWILLVVFILASPSVPYLRWEYTYKPYGNTRVYIDCHYIGLGGLIRHARSGDCPLIIWIDR